MADLARQNWSFTSKFKKYTDGDALNINQLILNFNQIIEKAKTERHGDATVRTFTIYQDVIMYLISKDKLTMSDREQSFWHYTKTYTTSALYRVAEHYRKENGMPPLNHKQTAYHNSENTLEEWRELRS